MSQTEGKRNVLDSLSSHVLVSCENLPVSTQPNVSSSGIPGSTAYNYQLFCDTEKSRRRAGNKSELRTSTESDLPKIEACLSVSTF